MSGKSESLARDYLKNARDFVWAAEQINVIAPQSTAEGMFVAENPLYFLLGHASELILKSFLAQNHISEKDLRSQKYRHDLLELMSFAQNFQVPLDSNFIYGVQCIAENFKNHDQRYARSFSGFSAEDHEKWMKGQLSKQELRDYGLVVRSGVNVNQFLLGLNKQLTLLVNLSNTQKAA
jgi:hypothetical protein